MFYLTEFTDVCKFAKILPFVCDSDLKHPTEKLEHNTKLAIEWFENCHMKLNEDKCHLLVAGHRYEILWADIGETRIWKTKNENYLD